MKTKIGEKSNKPKIHGVKDFLKVYPGAGLLAGLVLVGGISIGAMTLSNDNDDDVVLENNPPVEQEVKPEAETPVDNKEENKEENKTEDKKDDEKVEGTTEEEPAKEEDNKEETPAEGTTSENTPTTPSTPAENAGTTGTTTTPAEGTTNNNTTGTATPATDDKKEDDKKEEDKKEEGISDISASSSSLSANVKKYQKDVNSDTVGWIQVPNTNISYPVVQASDNNYYAAKDIYKNASQNGVIYADYECKLNGTVGSTNTILYGHNWTNVRSPIRKNNANDVMFAQLHSYVYLDVAQKSPFIYFSTANKDYVWQVFSVFYTPSTWTDYIYAEPNSGVVKTAIKNSIHDFNVNVSSSDKILTLSTCTRMLGNHNNQRFVVMAKLVPAGTAATNITAK